MHMNAESWMLFKFEKGTRPCHTKGDSLKEVVDGEGEDDEETTSCCHNSILRWQGHLPVAVPMALTCVWFWEMVANAHPPTSHPLWEVRTWQGGGGGPPPAGRSWGSRPAQGSLPPAGQSRGSCRILGSSGTPGFWFLKKKTVQEAGTKPHWHLGACGWGKMWGWRPRQTWWGRRTGSPWWPSAKEKRVNIIGFFGFSFSDLLAFYLTKPTHPDTQQWKNADLSGKGSKYKVTNCKMTQWSKMWLSVVQLERWFLNSKFQSDLKGFVNCKAWLASFDLQGKSFTCQNIVA